MRNCGFASVVCEASGPNRLKRHNPPGKDFSYKPLQTPQAPKIARKIDSDGQSYCFTHQSWRLGGASVDT